MLWFKAGLCWFKSVLRMLYFMSRCWQNFKHRMLLLYHWFFLIVDNIVCYLGVCCWFWARWIKLVLFNLDSARFNLRIYSPSKYFFVNSLSPRIVHLSFYKCTYIKEAYLQCVITTSPILLNFFFYTNSFKCTKK